MVQIKVKNFSRNKTEIQPEVIPINEDIHQTLLEFESNLNTSRNEEEANEIIYLPIVNELDDLTNVNFNKKINNEAEEILKKVIDKKK